MPWDWLMQSRLREAASFFLLGFFMDRGIHIHTQNYMQVCAHTGRPWLLRRGSDGGRAGNPSRFDKIRCGFVGFVGWLASSGANH